MKKNILTLLFISIFSLGACDLTPDFIKDSDKPIEDSQPSQSGDQQPAGDQGQGGDQGGNQGGGTNSEDYSFINRTPEQMGSILDGYNTHYNLIEDFGLENYEYPNDTWFNDTLPNDPEPNAEICVTESLYDDYNLANLFFVRRFEYILNADLSDLLDSYKDAIINPSDDLSIFYGGFIDNATHKEYNFVYSRYESNRSEYNNNNNLLYSFSSVDWFLLMGDDRVEYCSKHYDLELRDGWVQDGQKDTFLDMYSCLFFSSDGTVTEAVTTEFGQYAGNDLVKKVSTLKKDDESVILTTWNSYYTDPQYELLDVLEIVKFEDGLSFAAQFDHRAFDFNFSVFDDLSRQIWVLQLGEAGHAGTIDFFVHRQGFCLSSSFIQDVEAFYFDSTWTDNEHEFSFFGMAANTVIIDGYTNCWHLENFGGSLDILYPVASLFASTTTGNPYPARLAFAGYYPEFDESRLEFTLLQVTQRFADSIPAMLNMGGSLSNFLSSYTVNDLHNLNTLKSIIYEQDITNWEHNPIEENMDTEFICSELFPIFMEEITTF